MIHEQASAVLSALRTLDTERRGLDALNEAMRATGDGGLGAAFSRAVRDDRGGDRPRHRHRHGQVRARRPEDRRDARLHRPAGRLSSMPAEASHGDLGMVQNGDVVLALSWSGETVELAAIVTFAKRYAIPLIAMTAAPESALGREADICLDPAECGRGLPERPRADHVDDDAARPRGRAGDRAARGPRLHRPRLSGPASGRKARRQAAARPRRHAYRRAHSPHRGAAPGWRTRSSRCPRRALVAWRRSTRGKLVGIVTDGDLRRHLKAGYSLETPVADVMTRKPRTIAPDALVAEALESISHKISALLVVEDRAGRRHRAFPRSHADRRGLTPGPRRQRLLKNAVRNRQKSAPAAAARNPSM